ncbi:PREDICTED: uncharacterized protein LOC104799910 [Tarenaya hassleriana]|uniref:uncharacterized protein LOC104799910 n=1 Tax=Tarenaya hassleriana TaxID=28532 RepID=UPI00053C57D9|nr:PREDICTED: uncharacterized protein LOC104799910 [Tarenaya hassleriana]
MRERGKMGIWDTISSAGDSLRRNAPGLTSVKSFCRSSYDHTCYAVAKIGSAVGGVGNAVKVHGVDKVAQQLREEESRAAIRRFSGSFAVNAAVFAFHEGLKSIPGGAPIYGIVSRSVSACNNQPNKQEELKELRARMELMEKELAAYKTLLEKQGFERHELEVLPRTDPLRDAQKLEDVMKVSMGQITRLCLLDDLIVPGVRASKKSE